MSHTCKALVIHCMDFRFHSAIRDFLNQENLDGSFDLVSLAGATKGLVEEDAPSKEILLKQIDISSRLHHISQVVLLHHMDCGAYGGHKAFANEVDEKVKQIEDMRMAKKIILNKFPRLDVSLVLANIDQLGNPESIAIEKIN